MPTMNTAPSASIDFERFRLRPFVKHVFVVDDDVGEWALGKGGKEAGAGKR